MRGYRQREAAPLVRRQAPAGFPWGRLSLALPGLAILWAAAASAQPQAAVPHLIERHPTDYQALPYPGGEPMTNVFSSSSAHRYGNAAPLILPFPFRFFGKDYTELAIATSGYVTFGSFSDAELDTMPNFSRERYNRDIPPPFDSTFNPSRMIALWWDDMDCRGRGSLRKQLLGSAPKRVMVIEWRRCYPYDSRSVFGGVQPDNPQGLLHMQLWLHEDSETIEVRYGDIEEGGDSNKHSASVGIVDLVSTDPHIVEAYTDFSCNPTCNASHWPVGQAVFYSPEANLSLLSLEAPSHGAPGLELPLRVHVANRGLRTARQIQTRAWLSTSAEVGPTSILLGDARTLRSLAHEGEATIEFAPLLPESLKPGAYFLVVQLDPDEEIPEIHEDDNFAVARLEVGTPRPELRIEAASVPSRAMLGETIEFEWLISNRGSAPVARVPYTMRLSRAGSEGLSGLELGSGTISLAPGSRLERKTTLPLPESVREGEYWISLWIDPLSELLKDGSSERSVSAGPIRLGTSTLQILTASLPPAELGSPWCVFLEARGGDPEEQRWELSAGSSLPPGLRLQESESPGGATLCGRPAAAGDFSFDLEVHSGDQVVVHTFLLEVAEAQLELSIATEELPAIRFEEPFETRLSAVGGQPPYRWSIVTGQPLPPGIELDPEGILHGSSTTPGAFPFGLLLEDTAGRTVRAQMLLLVSQPPTLRCTGMDEGLSLPLGEEADFSLQAVGGAPPLHWSSRYAFLLGEGGGGIRPLPEGAPLGLNLDSEGHISGIPQHVGRYLWQVEVMDSQGRASACNLSVQVGGAGGPRIITAQLAPAYLGKPYRSELRAAGTSRLRWSLLPSSELPDGLDLDADGGLHGLPSAIQTRSFLVEVRDEAGRVAVAPFSLEVQVPSARTETATDESNRNGGGCGTSGPTPSATLALFGLIFAWTWLLPRVPQRE